MEQQLAGKVALVTGAGSGLGAGIAQELARAGAKVLVNDLDGEAAERVAAQIGPGAAPLTADIANAQAVAGVFREIVARYDGIDIVVNNAGTTHRNMPMTEVTEEDFDRVFAVNVKSCYLTAMHAVPLFERRQGGAILNIASAAGVRPRPGLTWYCATKGAVITLTKAMAVELAPAGVRVNAICPVAADTPLLASFLPEDTPAAREAMVASIPLGRLTTAQDVARSALFLLSDQASFITGAVLNVDGGRCI